MRGEAFGAALTALASYDFLDCLSDVEAPTLIVWGRNDNVVPPGDALEYGRRLRNSRTVIFDDTGHVPMAERPVRFNRVLETFLAEP
jgi:2-hydroxy-6-oxonona-2,4-dienedioate hydrolase